MIYFPNCKINIGLNVVQKRDDGFHNIETLLYPIDVEDILEIRPNGKEETILTLTGLPIKSHSNSDNLCIKAYNILKKDFPEAYQAYLDVKEEARNSMESSKAKILEKINESKVEETLP